MDCYAASPHRFSWKFVLNQARVNNSSLKILYTITAYPPAIGGAQLHTHKIVSLLSQTNRVRVITHWTENRTDWLLGTTLRAPEQVKDYEIEGVEVKQITVDTSEKISLIPYVLGYYGIKKLALDKISDVLVPKLEKYAREFDLIQNVRMGREGISYASLKVARKFDIPFVFVPLHHPRWVGWNYRESINLYRVADAAIALTNVEKQTLIELGVKEENIFVTGIGPLLADTSEPDKFRQKYSLGQDPIVLFLGQKYRYKGVEAVWLAAQKVWEKFPDLQFVFIGPRTKFSQKVFARVSDRRVLELPSVSLEEKTSALAACDILCVPSMQESFGGVYTEGWMMGKPVIGGNIPAIADVIEDGVDGLLVEQDRDRIAEKIIHLMNNPSLRTQMGEAGRQKVLEKYTWEKLAEKMKFVYNKVLQG